MPSEYRIIGGPYDNFDLAVARARPELFYTHLLRTALKNGLLRAADGHTRVTAPVLSEWTGYSVPTIHAWLRPRTSLSYRPIPRSAIRLILHEFKLRDQSTYAWDKLLKWCQ